MASYFQHLTTIANIACSCLTRCICFQPGYSSLFQSFNDASPAVMDEEEEEDESELQIDEGEVGSSGGSENTTENETEQVLEEEEEESDDSNNMLGSIINKPVPTDIDPELLR